MAAFGGLFGDVLLTKDGEKPTTEVLQDKTVGIYFSAHWCPPCRGFTPQLAEWYTKDLKAKGLEIVFVSSDREEEAFTSYFGEQPWVALPYADRDRKNALSKKFKVQGIPTFVLVDQDGNTITTDGREAVTSDPTGAKFPWKPKPLSELLNFEVQTKEGKVPMASLSDKVLALYFSAHWCPPCRGFTPQLATQYQKIKDAGHPLEVIFVSSDRDEAAFNEYWGEQPWATLPYAERELKEDLSKAFGVEGIPSLVLLDKDRSIITKNGRGAIMGDVSEFPFYPKPVSDLAQSADGINDAPCIVIMADAAEDDAKTAAYAAMEPVAKEYNAKAKAAKEDPEVLFFIAKSGGGVVPRIRQLCKMTGLLQPHEHPLEEKDASAAGWGCDGCGKPGTAAKQRFRCTQGCDFDYCEECNEKAQSNGNTREAPTMLLLDVSDNGAYYKSDHPITEAGVRAMLDDFNAKKLTRLQFGQ